MLSSTTGKNKKPLSFAKRIVKHLPQAVRDGLPAEISVVSVSEKKTVALNRAYRKKHQPANVLSFLYPDVSFSSPRKRGYGKQKTGFPIKSGMTKNGEMAYTYGEIIVCSSVIRAEAKSQHHSFQYQMTWMILHGMIHLSGLHHEKSAATARRVERMEKRILKKLAQV